jgi:signal transduction histidine kinase
VIRHASAQRVDVVLERRGNLALVLVEDDGKGFDVEPTKTGGHLGLLGVEERAQMLGGKLTVESVPGKGTTLVVEIPYADSDFNRG